MKGVEWGGVGWRRKEEGWLLKGDRRTGCGEDKKEKGPCPWKSAKAREKAGENWRFLASQQAPLLSTAFQNAADPTPAHSPTHVRQGSASGSVSGSARLLEVFWVLARRQCLLCWCMSPNACLYIQRSIKTHTMQMQYGTCTTMYR